MERTLRRKSCRLSGRKARKAPRAGKTKERTIREMTKVQTLVWVVSVLVLVGFVAGCGSASDQTRREAKKKVENKAQQIQQEAKQKVEAKKQQAKEKVTDKKQELKKKVDDLQKDVTELKKEVTELQTDSSGSAPEEVEKTKSAERSLTKTSDKAVKRSSIVRAFSTRLVHKVVGVPHLGSRRALTLAGRRCGGDDYEEERLVHLSWNSISSSPPSRSCSTLNSARAGT